MKRIIVACDGTGQSASRGEVSVSTNVNRFGHALLSDPKTTGVEQIVFYQSGIGTEDLGKTSNLVQGAIGKGIENNIADGYNFVVNNYIDGDQLFIFGFSRGAFTARVLANFIARVGIFRKQNSGSFTFKPAFRAYTEGPEKFAEYLQRLRNASEHDEKSFEARAAKAKLKSKADKTEDEGKAEDEGEAEDEDEAEDEGKLENQNYVRRVSKVKVTVVGCWDTVASLGIPWHLFSEPGGVTGDYQYYDSSLVEGIEHAFHALSLDEYRAPFTPTLWYLPDDDEVAQNIDLHQCWFPGVHSNIGGGYPDQALADLTLAWMIDLCRPYLDFDEKYIKMLLNHNHHPWKNHDSEYHNDAKHGGPDRVYQGWARGKQYNSYKKGQTWTWRYRTPGAYGKPVERTRETMHMSVRERWLNPPEGQDWRPMALKGFELKQQCADGQWAWVKHLSGEKEIVIGEEPFDEKAEGNFEWLLRYAPGPVAPGPQSSAKKNQPEDGSSCIVM